jgi:RNA polymerase sigma-70 factor (ECF subfamily)
LLPQTTSLTTQQLFREHGAFVWRVLRRLGVAESDIEDVCQEVFMAVHQQLPSFEGRSKPSTWIYAIARRRASSYRQRAHRRREQVTGTLPEMPTPDVQTPHSDAEQAQARRTLDRLLDGLDDAKREVFVLYEIEGLEMRKVVEIVGCALQTGYSRLHAARDQLRHAALQAGVDK